jgi:ATP-dependent Clp protease ATP-binding subunit ClpA
MFERFTADARQVVVDAQHEARQMHTGHIGTEHLLLALLAQPTTLTAAVLTRHGLTHDAVARSVRSYVSSQGLDAEALSSVGIDLDAVRESVEATFGPGALDAGRRTVRGHIPFSPRAKKVLELSLREALALKQKSISDGHIALGLLREGEGLAMKALADLGVDPAAVRQDIRVALNP